MEFLGKISGKAVEDKLSTFGEVYGEVLVGLHRDLGKQSSLLEDCRQQLEAQTKHIGRLRATCRLSYAFALLIGVVACFMR